MTVLSALDAAGRRRWLVVMPHTATPSHPCSRSQAARRGDGQERGVH
jgi:hypothetical protein